jgi:hypothetical protein
VEKLDFLLHLRGVRERLLGQGAQLVRVVGEAGTEAAESKRGPDQDGVAQVFG